MHGIISYYSLLQLAVSFVPNERVLNFLRAYVYKIPKKEYKGVSL